MRTRVLWTTVRQREPPLSWETTKINPIWTRWREQIPSEPVRPTAANISPQMMEARRQNLVQDQSGCCDCHTAVDHLLRRPERIQAVGWLVGFAHELVTDRGEKKSRQRSGDVASLVPRRFPRRDLWKAFDLSRLSVSFFFLPDTTLLLNFAAPLPGSEETEAAFNPRWPVAISLTVIRSR